MEKNELVQLLQYLKPNMFLRDAFALCLPSTYDIDEALKILRSEGGGAFFIDKVPGFSIIITRFTRDTDDK